MNDNLIHELENLSDGITNVGVDFGEQDDVRAARKVSKCRETLATLTTREAEHVTDISNTLLPEYVYFNRLARATLHLMIARLTPSASTEDGLFPQSEVDNALALLFELERLDHLKGDAFLRYKIRQCVDIKGERYAEVTAEKSVEAAMLLDQDVRIKEDSMLRSVIPRLCGFHLWQVSQKIVNDWGLEGASPPFKEERKENLKSAVEATLQSLSALQHISPKYQDFVPNTQRSQNNLICYAWELADLGFRDEVMRMLEDVDLQSIIDSIEQMELEPHQKISLEDSLMKAHDLLGHADKAIERAMSLDRMINTETLVHATRLGGFDFVRYCISRVVEKNQQGE